MAPELSAIVLCYRSGANLLPFAAALYQELGATGVPFELVLVANFDEGSTDETPDVARRFADGHPGTRVLAEPKRGAMGWDLRAGLSAASGRVLVITDGDGQYASSDVVRAYRVLCEAGVDVAKGRRRRRGDGAYRRVVSTAYNAVFALLFPGRGFSDVNGKPKAITRAAYGRLELRSDDWFLDAELMLEAHRHGLSVREFPVTFSEGARASFVRPAAIVEFARHMLRYRITGRP